MASKKVQTWTIEQMFLGLLFIAGFIGVLFNSMIGYFMLGFCFAKLREVFAGLGLIWQYLIDVVKERV
jgi:hypothetical protein